MGDLDVRNDPADRVAEAVRHALRLVGPAERGVQRAIEEKLRERPTA